MQYLAQGIKHATTLNKLIMDDCNIKPPPESFEIFSEGVYQSASLNTLSFCNYITTTGSATWIANLVNSDHGGLIDLDLSGNDLSLMVSPLASVLRNNNTLLNLCLSNCKITHEGLTYLSNALVRCWGFRFIHLVSNVFSLVV